MVTSGALTLRLEASGWLSSLGQPVMKPGPRLRTAVRFSATAFAVDGMPTRPVTAKSVVPSAGIWAPPTLVSRRRSGEIGTKSPSSVSYAVVSVK